MRSNTKARSTAVHYKQLLAVGPEEKHGVTESYKALPRKKTYFPHLQCSQAKYHQTKLVDVILVDALLRGYSGATGFEHLLVSDAKAALSLLRTPSISKSRLWGMRTTHHVDLGGLRDFWRSPGRRAQWRNGHLLAPDLGTKAVSKDTHTRLLPQLRVMPMSETSRSLP